ncbi:hypothetical protein QIW31_06025 [Francisellaceae bacterium CB299]
MSFNKKPVKKEVLDNKEEISKFINEPINGTNTYKSVKNNELPWITFDQKSKTRKLFNVRFNEYYESAYKYFADKLEYDSYQNFVRGVIEEKLDELIDKESK